MQESLEPAELPTDLETISDEERFLFRKIGLSMKPYLLLGMYRYLDSAFTVFKKIVNNVRVCLSQGGEEFLMVRSRIYTCTGSIES